MVLNKVLFIFLNLFLFSSVQAVENIETTPSNNLENSSFHIASILPNINSIGTTPFSPEQLSAIFVVFLWGIFVIFLIQSTLALIASNRKTTWVFTLLKDITGENIAEKRRDLLKEAKNNKHLGGHAWQEFNESLIEATDGNNNTKLYNTIDSEHFFNSSTLANKITESRMLAAVPGFLTAIGVVGTFIGLQMGLSGLNIGNDVQVSEMKSGLSIVISGAKIAFITSVWGVLLSVVFNYIEKLYENSARKKIHLLQIKIDNIFDRMPAERQLQYIVDDGRESRESLQGLAEQIGERMQDSLIEATASIQSGLEASLEKIMAPAINKLVDETADGNQKALDGLIDNFLDKFGEQGSNQREAMDAASKNVSETFGSLNSSLTTFLEKLEDSQNNTADREKELMTTISNQVSQLVVQSTEQRKILTDAVENQVQNLSDLFHERENTSLARDEKRQEVFVEQTSNLKQASESLLDNFEIKMNAQSELTKELLSQGELLQSSVNSSIKANNEASANLMASSTELKMASQDIKMFGAQIKEAGNTLSNAFSDAVTSTADLSRQNQKSSELMEEYRERLINDQNQFSQISERLQSMISSVDSSFDKMNEHQNAFLNDLKNNVSELSKQMTSLLSDYSEQANAQTARHLGVWAEHTTNYAQQMNTAATALSSVVDEIENKLSQ